MLTESPFSTRHGTLDALRKQGVVPVAAAADAAELVAAILLVEDAVSYDDLRSELNALRDHDEHLDRDLSTVGMTADAILEKLTTCRIVKAEPDGRLAADDEVAVGWLGGRGIVRFIHLLRPATQPAVAWADTLAKLAWGHPYREARTSMARQLVFEQQYDQIESLCDWLHAHCTQGLDDLSQSLKFCLWQFSVEMLNAGLPNDPQRFGRWATATMRFATIERGHLFPLLGMPAEWASLLNRSGAEAWQKQLFDAMNHDDPVIQNLAWEALKSHSQISEQGRIRLADIALSDKDAAERAAAVLSNQLPTQDEVLSISRIVDGLDSSKPDVVRRCVGILLNRINQPNIQHYVQANCGPYATDDTIFKMAHQILRAAKLNQQTLDALVKIVLERPAWYAEQACKVLLAQYELEPELLEQLEVGEGQLELFLFLFARRYRSHLMLRFGQQVTPFQFPYGRHAKSYRPDPIVTSRPTDFTERNQEQFDWLLSHIVLDDGTPGPQAVIDAFVSARVFADARSLPVEPFVTLLSTGHPLQRAVVERALKPHIASNTGNIYIMMKHDRQLVASSLAGGSDLAVIVTAPDRLRPVLRRILKPGWQYCTSDDFKLGLGRGDEQFECFDRESLTLDDSLRGNDLIDAVTDDQDDDAVPDAQGEVPDASESQGTSPTPSTTVDVEPPDEFRSSAVESPTQQPATTGQGPVEGQGANSSQAFELLYGLLNAMRAMSQQDHGLRANDSTPTPETDGSRSIRREGNHVHDSESDTFLRAFQSTTASTDEVVRLYIVEVMKRVEVILTRDAQTELDDDAFARMLRDLSDRLSRLKCSAKPLAAFLYFLAWCAVHRAYRAEYAVVTQGSCLISLALLPQHLRDVLQSEPITNAGTLTRNIDRFFEQMNFREQLEQVVRECAGLKDKRRAVRVTRR